MINIGNKSMRKGLKSFCKKTLQNTPPLWTDLVKVSSRKPRHASSFFLESTDFRYVTYEKSHWAHSEDAEVAEIKQP